MQVIVPRWTGSLQAVTWASREQAGSSGGSSFVPDRAGYTGSTGSSASSSALPSSEFPKKNGFIIPPPTSLRVYLAVLKLEAEPASLSVPRFPNGGKFPPYTPDRLTEAKFIESLRLPNNKVPTPAGVILSAEERARAWAGADTNRKLDLFRALLLFTGVSEAGLSLYDIQMARAPIVTMLQQLPVKEPVKEFDKYRKAFLAEQAQTFGAPWNRDLKSVPRLIYDLVMGGGAAFAKVQERAFRVMRNIAAGQAVTGPLSAPSTLQGLARLGAPAAFAPGRSDALVTSSVTSATVDPVLGVNWPTFERRLRESSSVGYSWESAAFAGAMYAIVTAESVTRPTRKTTYDFSTAADASAEGTVIRLYSKPVAAYAAWKTAAGAWAEANKIYTAALDRYKARNDYLKKRANAVAYFNQWVAAYRAQEAERKRLGDEAAKREQEAKDKIAKEEAERRKLEEEKRRKEEEQRLREEAEKQRSGEGIQIQPSVQPQPQPASQQPQPGLPNGSTAPSADIVTPEAPTELEAGAADAGMVSEETAPTEQQIQLPTQPPARSGAKMMVGLAVLGLAAWGVYKWKTAKR